MYDAVFGYDGDRNALRVLCSLCAQVDDAVFGYDGDSNGRAQLEGILLCFLRSGMSGAH